MLWLACEPGSLEGAGAPPQGPAPARPEAARSHWIALGTGAGGPEAGQGQGCHPRAGRVAEGR